MSGPVDDRRHAASGTHLGGDYRPPLAVRVDLASGDLMIMDERRFGRARAALVDRLESRSFGEGLPRPNLEALGLRAGGGIDSLPRCNWAWGPVLGRRHDQEAFWLAIFRLLDDAWLDVLCARLGYRNPRSSFVPAGNPVAVATTRLAGLWEAVSYGPGDVVHRTILAGRRARRFSTGRHKRSMLSLPVANIASVTMAHAELLSEGLCHLLPKPEP